MTDTAPILPFATFLGDKRGECEWDGFSFCEVIDRAEQEIPLHTHQEAHFFLLLRGSYISSARGADEGCSPRTLMFLPQWTTHRDRFRMRGGSFFTMSIQPELLGHLAGDQRLVDYAMTVDFPACKMLSYRIYKEFCLADEFSSTVMAGLTLELLGWAAHVTEPTAGRQPPRWLHRVSEEIRDPSPERVTVRQLAETAGVHPLHFAKIFRRFYHCSPGEYLRQSRVERAAGLLSSSAVPLAEVALRTGFSDQSQLTKAFRGHTGMTPAEFRRSFGR